MPEQQPARSDKLRGLAIPALACLGLIAVSIVLALWRVSVQESELREKVLTETLALAQSLAPRPLEIMPPGASERDSDSFSRLSCHLHRLARFAGYREIWTLGQIAGAPVPGPGSQFASDDCAERAQRQNTPTLEHPPGVLPPEIGPVLASGQATITRVYRRDGTAVLSALAPIKINSERKQGDRLVGVDIAANHWRAALWGAAILPLSLGGLLTLVFALATWSVYRNDADSDNLPSGPRYLEPLLAAVTGVTLSIAATAIAYQLERHLQSDLLEWVGSRTSLDLRMALGASPQGGAGLAPPPADRATAPAGSDDGERLLVALRQVLRPGLEQRHRFKARIDAELLLLTNTGNAQLVGRIPAAETTGRPTTAPVPPLSSAARLQELLPVFLGDRTFAVRLKIAANASIGPPLRAALATATIGLILTAVATVLVFWLRERLADLEQLLKRRTAALQQREANFTAITNAVRDAIVMMDAQSRIVYWNPAAEQSFGYTESEAKGQDLHRLLAGPDAAAAYRGRDPGAETLAKRSAVERLVEVVGRHKDGSQVPLELSLSAMSLDGAWHAIGVLRDISRRKRSQERLVKLNDCLARLDSDYRENIRRITSVCGEILDADSALYNRLENGKLMTLGRWNVPADLPAVDTPEGHICHDLILGRDDRARGPCGGQALGNRTDRDAFFLGDLSVTPYAQIDPTVRGYDLKAYFGHAVRRGRDKVGSLCVVFKRQRQPNDEEKRLLGILAAALTTEENRHQASRELELSEKRMSLAMLGTGIGIWEYEPATRELRLDSAMHGLLGLEPVLAARAIADWMRRLAPEDRSDFQQRLETALGENGELDSEVRLQMPDHEQRYLRVIGSRHREARDHAPYLIGVCYDITRRKQGEARLRLARDTAEKASRLKTQFLSQVSHELRTPMNAVLGFAQLLDSDPDLNADQRDSVREILHSGRHLLELIDEVLDLAQVESGETEIRIQRILLGPALEESLAHIRTLAKDHGLGLDFAVADDLAVAADPFRLRQVLVNLLSNAVKYNRPGGSIALAAEATTDARVRISVRDTGIGVPADQRDELFEPFRRLPEAQIRGIEGSGVGLAVVKRLVERMGGQIGVDSTPGEGSCFWFDLPRAPTATAAAPLLKPDATAP